MKIALIIAVILVVFVALFLWRRRRVRRKKFFREGLKHPTGYLKYHQNTSTCVRRRLAGDEAAAKEAPSKEAQAVASLQFKGDLRASSRRSLSRLIDEVILNKDRLCEVVVNVESPGGSVTDYGHVYAEMCRLKEAGLKLTACVDTVAASGGYLACLPADQIIAAPFAMVGSIGVVSFVPNVRRLLERFLIEPRTFTAGDFKRTVTLTDNATPEQIELYKQQLQLIHDQFKHALSKHRPQVNVTKVATGEAWLAATSLELKLDLVDRVGVSADYLLERNRKHDIVEFSEKTPRVTLIRRWMGAIAQLLSQGSLGETADEIFALA